jgi:hypothetical protein
MIRDELITPLGRQNLRSDDDRARADQTKAPTDSAENPRLVQLPANEEPVLVVEKICLQNTRLVSTSTPWVIQALLSIDGVRESGHTTIDMPAACTMADKIIKRLRTRQPFSRSRFPPPRIIM